MKNLFHYFLLLTAIILPLFFLFEDEEKFPILAGIFIGISIAYWTAILILEKRKKGRRKKEKGK
jgi:hypothetical protein